MRMLKKKNLIITCLYITRNRIVHLPTDKGRCIILGKHRNTVKSYLNNRKTEMNEVIVITF